jgi:hypothetical protein
VLKIRAADAAASAAASALQQLAHSHPVRQRRVDGLLLLLLLLLRALLLLLLLLLQAVLLLLLLQQLALRCHQLDPQGLHLPPGQARHQLPLGGAGQQPPQLE